MTEKSISVAYIGQTNSAEAFLLISLFIELFTPEFVGKYKLLKRLEALKKAFKHYDNLYDANRISIKTADVVEADKRRDDYLIGLRGLIDSLAKAGTAEEKEKVAVLLHMFRNYRTANRLSFVENTGKLRSFISEAGKEPYASIIDSLNLKSRVEELERLNDAFEEIFYSRAGDSMTKIQQASLGKTKTELTQLYRALADRVSALYAIAIDDEDIPTVTELGKFIDQANIILFSIHKRMRRRGVKIANQDAGEKTFDESEGGNEGSSSEGISL